MKQVLQRIDGAATEVRDIPAPVCNRQEVLIANAVSLISPGTEKAVVALARKSLIAKARERPDQVRRVLQKMSREGFFETLRQVRTKLSEPISLGYACAGVVLEVGAGVAHVQPGDRVASNGAHAGVVCASQNLVVKIPDGVTWDQGCYASIGAIALQGVRLAHVGLSDVIVVIGLGLIGQITVRLLIAAGARVLATDLDPQRCAAVAALGAEAVSAAELPARVLAASADQGADAVLITASTPGNGPLELAAACARRKARIIAVGAVGMDVPRREFYPKELELVVSCSYGPGRYDPRYEERGEDYPIAYVRWSAQRNMGAFLDLIARGRLDVADLTTHRFPIAEGENAYELIASGQAGSLGILLTYPDADDAVHARFFVDRRIVLPTPTPAVAPASTNATTTNTPIGLGVIGAGNYGSLVLLPLLAATAGSGSGKGDSVKTRLRVLASARGVSAVTRGLRHGFEIAATDPQAVWDDPIVDAVFLLTRHDSHAGLACSALRAGKAVYVEKPLALTSEELQSFIDAENSVADRPGVRPPLWCVGFNRRFAPASILVRNHCDRVGPRALTYRFNAGPIPAEHWTRDALVGGGRILGELCHAVDLALFLLGSPVIRVTANTLGTPGAILDQGVVTAEHADGSLSTFQYFSGGDKRYPKERVELYGGGKIGVIDDFRTVELVDAKGVKRRRIPRGDKGHGALVAAFLRAVRDRTDGPIPAAELLHGARVMLAADLSLRLGMPVPVPPFAETPTPTPTAE